MAARICRQSWQDLGVEARSEGYAIFGMEYSSAVKIANSPVPALFKRQRCDQVEFAACDGEG